MDNWNKGILGDFITLQRGFDLPAYDRHSGNVPVVTSAGISDFHNEAKVKAPGVAMGRYGTIGAIYFIREDFWPHNTTLYVKDFKGNDPHFVSYFLRTLNYQAHNDKSSVPGLNRNHLHLIPVIFPSLPEQRAIAGILGALDDKIEVNRRMNVTLESMARAVFRSWFIDFEPIRAKADGYKPADMNQETAALFPNKFKNTEIGDIPSSWDIMSIEEVAERVSMGPFGSSIKVETFVDEGIPIISGPHLRGFMLNDSAFNFVSLEHAEKLKNANVYRGDIIFTHAGNIGNLAFIPDDSEYTRYIISQRQFYMRCNLQKVTPGFITLYFQSPEGQHKLLANMSSVGVPSIAQPVSYLRSIKLPIPPKPILGEFESFVSPLLRKYRANVRQSRTLASLRDSLLPKLMRGEVRVKDVEGIL